MKEHMKVVSYLRVSTGKQDTEQQKNAISEWLKSNHLRSNRTISDEGVSGGVSYKSRKLGTDVLPQLERGDILIVSELSRLGRSMNDVSRLVNEELKPRGVRLVAPRSNFDLDCTQMNAQTQMLLACLTFAAQMEKEMIQQRTQSAIDVRQQKIKKHGGFTAKRSGRYVTKLGAPAESLPTARLAAVEARREAARNNPTNVALWSILQKVGGGKCPNAEQLRRGVLMCTDMELTTPTGRTINTARLRNSYHTLSKIFNTEAV